MRNANRKKGFNASAKSIGSGQPARTAQADLSRYFLPYVSCTHAKGLFSPTIKFVFIQKGLNGSIIIRYLVWVLCVESHFAKVKIKQ